MRVINYIVAILSVVNAATFIPANTSLTDELARKALNNVLSRSSRQHPSSLPSSSSPINESTTCTIETASIRKEWHTLSTSDQKSYIAAVLCLMHKPPISGNLVPGARSRYDDFLATHINQTLSIHGTGNFLSWHRYFTWTYEQALRNECAYKAPFPYFNWPAYAHDLTNAPIFDGSSTSLSGNGAFDPRNNGTYIPANTSPFIFLPPGPGGGCLTSGPFANETINLGPVSPALSYISPNPLPNGLGYNPRCIRRDLGVYPAKHWLTDADVYALITDSPHIGAFQTTMQGDFPSGFLGVHTSGHFVTGGDPGGDLFVSPGDPYFYLQHAQVDRVWWMWQNYLLPEGQGEDRIYVIANTTTLNNEPPSRNATLEDRIQLGVNDLRGWEGIRILEAVDTMKGPFCYFYE